MLTVMDQLPERIASRIDTSGECWRWLGWYNDAGYAYVRWEGRDQPLHRVLLGLARGEYLVRGIDADHLCQNTWCVNPSNLEAVPHRENIRRGRAATKMSCNHGHDWTDPRNVRLKCGQGRAPWRVCAACERESCKRYYRQRKATKC